jgi:hypothetical protein
MTSNPITSLFDRLRGDRTRAEPFVVDNPWEWPDTADRIEYDRAEDDDRLYNFQWAEPNCDRVTKTCYRDKCGRFTRFVHVEAQPDDPTYARAMLVFFEGSEQIHGEIREYEYESGEDFGTVEITCESYVATDEMPKMAMRDMQMMGGNMLETIGEIFTGPTGDW